MTNTTALIANWTMVGAVDDLEEHFESVVDIDALVAQRERESHDEPSTEAPLMLKPAGEDEWHALAGTAEGA